MAQEAEFLSWRMTKLRPSGQNNWLPLGKIKKNRRGKDMLQVEKTMSDSGIPEAHPAGTRTHILVVEDDPRMQKVLQRMFHEQGYTVTVCGDGQAGLDAFHGIKPSAVVLDLVF